MVCRHIGGSVLQAVLRAVINGYYIERQRLERLINSDERIRKEFFDEYAKIGPEDASMLYMQTDIAF